MSREAFFEAVRAATPSGIWSRGIQLGREASVASISEADDEVELEVRRGRDGYEVTLYLDDDEWDCSCDTGADCCEHVVAAVISWRAAVNDGGALAEREELDGRVWYQLQRVDEGLFLVRQLCFPDGRAVRLDMPIARYLSRRSPYGAIKVSDDDHALERALGERWGGRIGQEIAPRVLKALLRVRDLRLDDEPVRASLAAIMPIAVVSDHAQGGLELRLEQDPRIDEVFRCGWVRCGDVLHPIADGGLSRREMRTLRAGRHFTPDLMSELVGELLPRFKRDGLPVSVRTERLPRLTRAELPRLLVETEATLDARLRVVASIVYGDPVVARVVDGQLHVTGSRVPLRDHAEETRLAGELRRQLGLTLNDDALVADAEAVALAERLRHSRDVRVVGDAVERFRLAAPIAPELKVLEDGRLIAAFTGEHGVARADGVLRAWRSGRSLAPLDGGGYAPLPADWLSRFGHQLADLLAARDARGRLVPAAAPVALKLFEAMEEPAPEVLVGRVAALRASLESAQSRPELPEDLAATLRPYQAEGVAWLTGLGAAGLGALLADDMGLGKTVQSLAVVPGAAGRRTLVVAPTSVISNWRNEALRFRPSLRVCVFHGPKRQLDVEAHLTLTSYALLRIDAAALQRVEWDLVILDEAQSIKNPDSQVARAAYRLTAERRVALTGTPVENRLEELWSQFRFINPGLLGSREDFQERYAKPIAAGDGETVGRLRGRIGPFLRRRLKRDVAPELPPRTQSMLRVVLSEEERATYDAIAAATRKDVVERLRGGGNVMRALEALLRLRQACCDRAMIPGQTSEGQSAKVRLVAERLSIAAAAGHRALVFSQWTSLLDRVEPALADAGLGFLRLDGSTRDRGAVVEAFQRDDGPPVLLLSLKAGGTGLNLTAADHVFLMDPWWNPAVEDQASDRAYRIGQDKPVNVYRVVAHDTVEERILALQERKRALAEAALGEAEAAPSARLDRDELLALLA